MTTYFQPLLDNSPVRVSNSHSTAKYSKLENETDSPQRFLGNTLSQQDYLTRQQEEHLEAISDSLGSLKTVSRHIGIELDEQAGYVYKTTGIFVFKFYRVFMFFFF